MTFHRLREFVKLAGTYLACRLKVMGSELEGDPTKGDLAFHLLGMHDYECEMGLLLREVNLERAQLALAAGSGQK